MLDSVQGRENGYFSQAVAGYAQQRKPKLEENQKDPKTTGAFTEREWDRLLDKVNQAIGDDPKESDQCKTEALDKKKEQIESYILGSSARAAERLEAWLIKGTNAKGMHQLESGAQSEETKNSNIQDSAADTEVDALIQKLLGADKQAPYSNMADENGVVTYKGVTFQCDYENNRICLGDVSNLKNCISVSLEGGGCLVVNRQNIDQLSKAIGMFSPEDVNRIMRAIAQDAKLRQTQMQIEDEVSGVEVLEKSENKEELDT